MSVPTPLERWQDGVYLKREDAHELGAFKWRGALPVLERWGADVVTASTGNHGAATAWAARRLGLHATVFVPEEASAAKLALIRAQGADLIVMGIYGHSRVREFVMGGVSRTLLSSMTAPLLIAH